MLIDDATEMSPPPLPGTARLLSLLDDDLLLDVDMISCMYGVAATYLSLLTVIFMMMMMLRPLLFAFDVDAESKKV